MVQIAIFFSLNEAYRLETQNKILERLSLAPEVQSVNRLTPDAIHSSKLLAECFVVPREANQINQLLDLLEGLSPIHLTDIQIHTILEESKKERIRQALREFLIDNGFPNLTVSTDEELLEQLQRIFEES